MAELYYQAGEDPQRYRELLHQHGYTVRPGGPGYEEASKTLPCGWPGPQKPASEWCIHDLAPGTCSDCTGRGKEAPDERDPARFGPWFGARYPGHCAGCGEDFGAGDLIRADGGGGYLCDQCGGPS